jgi:SAM-dependent methyltransferase
MATTLQPTTDVTVRPNAASALLRERLVEAIAPGACIDSALAVVEGVYAESQGDHTMVPWSHARPNPALVAWLNARAQSVVRCGGRVCVVGCGLGMDAVALAKRGYDVTAFDACESAVRHAKSLHPAYNDLFRIADLRDLPGALVHRFDLVVEIHTLQALPPEHRDTLAKGIASLVAPHGRLLAIARGRADDEPLCSIASPPYAFTPAELIGLLGNHDLVPEGRVDDFVEGDPPARRLRGLFVRDGR